MSPFNLVALSLWTPITHGHSIQAMILKETQKQLGHTLLPFVGRMIILDAALHVLEFVQDGEHVDEFSQSEQVGFRHEVLPALSVAQPLHLTAEALDCFTLERNGAQV